MNDNTLDHLAQLHCALPVGCSRARPPGGNRDEQYDAGERACAPNQLPGTRSLCYICWTPPDLGRSANMDQKMKLLPLMLLVTLFSPCVVFADSAASVKPLPFDDFKKIAGERSVSIDAATRKAILELAKGLDPTPPELAAVVESLRADAQSISLEALMPLLEPQRGQSVSQKIVKHGDPLVRFVAGIVLSCSGDTDAAKTVHALIHDESLSLMDKRLIRTWCDGVGIRATRDDAAAIVDHLSTAMGGKPKFKKGDLAPSFEIKTTKGHKLSSRDLKGKVVVLHFWATTCGPCIGRMPCHIASLSKYDSKSVEVIFVSLDDDSEAFKATIEKFAIPFHNTRESLGWGGEVARGFGVNSMPFDIVIDKEGRVFSNSIADIDAALSVASIPKEGRTKP